MKSQYKLQLQLNDKTLRSVEFVRLSTLKIELCNSQLATKLINETSLRSLLLLKNCHYSIERFFKRQLLFCLFLTFLNSYIK